MAVGFLIEGLKLHLLINSWWSIASKVIYEVIIETKENLTQIEMSHNSCHTCITTNKDDQNYSA